MKKKEFIFNDPLRDKIVKGANTLADAVCVTLGPKGRNVILRQENKPPIITKDGATVAKFVDLPDEFEDLGAQIIKQAAETTNSTAGDGTTTATVLARAILSKGQKYINSGAAPFELKRQIDECVVQIVDKLKEMALPIKSFKDIEQIATISANGDSMIGKLIASTIEEVGKDGSVTIKEARSLKTTIEILDGFKFDTGMLSSDFVTDKATNSTKFEDPYFLITDHKLENPAEVFQLLELVAKDGKPLVIIADEFSGQFLPLLTVNVMRGNLKAVAIKAPRYGEERKKILDDIAVFTGGTFVSRESGLRFSDLKLVDLGSAKHIEVTQHSTVITEGVGDPKVIEDRIKSLRDEIKHTNDKMILEQLQERINRLISSVGVIYIGAATDVELVEKKHRIEDALEAVHSAQVEGIVPGGGMALARIAKELESLVTKSDGHRLVLDAILEPLRQLVVNAGKSPDVVLEKLYNEYSEITWNGYNVAEDKFCDMLREGILDPAKVTRCALQNAASAAGMLLTTGCAIIEK